MSSAMTEKVLAFLAAAQTTLGRRKSSLDPVGLEIQRVLELLKPLPPLSGWFPKSAHPATAFIGSTVKGATDATSALLDVTTPVIRHLPWCDSDPADTAEHALARRVALAELIGPEAPFRRGTVALGLALVAPNTHIPAHHHPASELFFVVTGAAQWILNGRPHENLPGAFVLLPPQSVHAIRTDSEPLLALYTRSNPEAREAADYSI